MLCEMSSRFLLETAFADASADDPDAHMIDAQAILLGQFRLQAAQLPLLLSELAAHLLLGQSSLDVPELPGLDHNLTAQGLLFALLRLPLSATTADAPLLCSLRGLACRVRVSRGAQGALAAVKPEASGDQEDGSPSATREHCDAEADVLGRRSLLDLFIGQVACVELQTSIECFVSDLGDLQSLPVVGACQGADLGEGAPEHLQVEAAILVEGLGHLEPHEEHVDVDIKLNAVLDIDRRLAREERAEHGAPGLPRRRHRDRDVNGALAFCWQNRLGNVDNRSYLGELWAHVHIHRLRAPHLDDVRVRVVARGAGDEVHVEATFEAHLFDLRHVEPALHVGEHRREALVEVECPVSQRVHASAAQQRGEGEAGPALR
mmetsp:Transcript_74547/g.201053  ORF Transcript_74547/g.201053 Transcript_74547/m.201053 type:complete len:377 (-) Transcript_74547:92-1222(-)